MKRALAIATMLATSPALASIPYGRSPWGLVMVDGGDGGGGSSAIDESGTASTDIDLSGFRLFDSEDECNLGTAAVAGSATTAGADCIFGARLEVDGALFADGGITLPSTGVFNWASRTQLSATADGNLLFRNAAGTNSGLLQFGGTTVFFPALRNSGGYLQLITADGGTMAEVQLGAVNRFATVGGGRVFTLSSSMHTIGNFAYYFYDNNTSIDTGNADTGFHRESAGILRINGGSTTTHGTLRSRQAYQEEGRLATVTADWNVTTKTTLYTCPAGVTCFITKVIERDASGTPTLADCAYGWNAGADDVIATSLGTGLSATTFRVRQSITGASTAAAEGAAAAVFGVQCDVANGAAMTVVTEVHGILQ